MGRRWPAVKVLTNSLCDTRETTGWLWESRPLNMRRVCGHRDCIVEPSGGFPEVSPLLEHGKIRRIRRRGAQEAN